MEFVLDFISQVFALLLSFLDPSLKSWLIVLIAFGVGMKQWAKMRGKRIPFAVMVAGLVIAFLNTLGRDLGLVSTLEFTIGQGLLLAFFSMSIYNVYQAVMDVIKEKSLHKANDSVVELAVESEETLGVNKEETK